MSGMARAHARVGWGFVGLVALQFFLGRRAVTLSVLVLFLAALQHVLPALREGAPVVAALHPVNALVLLVLGYAVACGRTLASLVAEPGASRAQAVR